MYSGCSVCTFEEDNLVVPRSLVHCVQAIQVGRQTPPKALDLGRTQRHQVLLPGQPPEVPPCYTQRRIDYY